MVMQSEKGSGVYGVAIVGCGLIGEKRARALSGARLVACADQASSRSESLAARHGGVACSWEEAVAREDVDIVLVATTNDALAEVTAGAMRAGKNVLVEKPVGRTTDEIRALLELERTTGVLVRVGFNHRHHPAIARAKAIVDEGTIGPIMFLRGRYGHGGRQGYDREWRADPERSGGGELIDQGIHLVDLSRWFLGDLTDVNGTCRTYYWDMAVEDNAFLTLGTPTGEIAFLQVSCTEWKNMFSLEIYGRTGKLQIDGLGGSYGVERLSHYQMRPEMGPPDTTIWEFPGEDLSWRREMDEFLLDIRENRRPGAGLTDALAALEVVERIYRGGRS